MEILRIDLNNSRFRDVVDKIADVPQLRSNMSSQDDILAAIRSEMRSAANVESSFYESCPEFRRFLAVDSPWGLAILTGLPKAELSVPFLFILAETVGKVAKYDHEGNYLIEVKQNPHGSALRPGFGNSREFFPHTDLSYAPAPPHYMCLQSIHNNAIQGGISTFCDIQDIARAISPGVLAALQGREFLFPAPAHYTGIDTVRNSILTTETHGRYTIRFRRDNLGCLTRAAIEAVANISSAIAANTEEVFLQENSLAIVNNRRTLHGRTAFSGGTRVPSRHINRVYFELS